MRRVSIFEIERDGLPLVLTAEQAENVVCQASQCDTSVDSGVL